ncbi:MAG: GWxTD domain-containing protein, partial [bacterium]|nr:GWxTD domain-containing protein [bacterium]
MKKNYPKHLIYGLTVLLAAFLMMMGTASYSYAKKAKLSPDHQEFYNYARYLMTKGERKLFFGIPTDEERQKFIDYFWEIRDPNPETEENEFKIEIERRFEYVNRYLKEGPIPGYKTDRGRLYLILGAPTNRLENSLNTSFAREIWWYFANSDIYARFVDANGNGIYYMDTNWVSLKLL